LFGINADNYVVDILNGRKEHPGKLKCIRPHKDSPMSMVKVNYTSWQAPEFRAYYFVVLNYILDQLKDGIDKATGKPGEAKIIVLTPAKKYAEGILKRSDVFVDFAKGRSQDSDDVKPAIDTNLSDYMEGALTDVRKIKDSDIELNGDVLRTDKQIIVSTRMVRGTDLRDNKCRAIVMTKWPVGDISDGYLQSIKKRFGEKIFWEIIKDKAAREAVQYVSRGLRHELDWTYFATVDSTAFDQVYRLFSYD
jgi:Rad3-related DNA helicase